MSVDPATAIIELASETDFESTMKRLVATIEAAGMSVFAKIDHAAAAQAAGLAMPPTVVVLYGNPKGGTPIMLAAPQSALELPLRMLLRESEGKVLLSYRPIAPVLQKAGVPDDLAARIAPGQEVLTKALRRPT